MLKASVIYAYLAFFFNMYMEIKSLALGFKEGIVLKGESNKNLINTFSVD